MWDKQLLQLNTRFTLGFLTTNNIGETELLILHICSPIDSILLISFNSLWFIYFEPKKIICKGCSESPGYKSKLYKLMWWNHIMDKLKIHNHFSKTTGTRIQNDSGFKKCNKLCQACVMYHFQSLWQHPTIKHKTVSKVKYMKNHTCWYIWSL